MARNTFMNSLECKLTKDEQLEYGHLQASLLAEISDLDLEKKELTKKQAPLKTEIKRLTEALNSGKEFREVECEWVYFWEAGTKQAKRLDNGQYTGGRVQIEESERQAEL